MGVVVFKERQSREQGVFENKKRGVSSAIRDIVGSEAGYRHSLDAFINRRQQRTPWNWSCVWADSSSSSFYVRKIHKRSTNKYSQYYLYYY
jgi:hypothetical protein